ncbi:GNAT family acetyltransferase [Tamlana sedimentorum]|uniref:GNAT family acetyltransferase n=1 Tax=Neotamlana sedimentorum TaxID=1435349 RepID=A0A0D7W8J4_9FLAO|nr:GNAT family N-acetyltransferase [Tamlana sedimentorum]KJD35008.1 GNAT family acetyltransferase [Tamlana sedimentorum]
MEVCIAKTKSDLFKIEALAKTIWESHYTPIIGEEQVAYMLKKYQSADAVKMQIESGYIYFIINSANEPLGYLAIKPEQDSLFLSKLYVLKRFRGKGFGKQAIAFVEEEALKMGLLNIRLTVNKYNRQSIKAYESIGFITTKKLLVEIGNGFVMDDYEMVKMLA